MSATTTEDTPLLTHDGQRDRGRLRVPLHVARVARVVPSLGPRHLASWALGIQILSKKLSLLSIFLLLYLSIYLYVSNIFL